MEQETSNTSFIPRSVARKSIPPIRQLKSVNRTETGKTYRRLLSLAKNRQRLSQFYVAFKGPIVGGLSTGSIDPSFDENLSQGLVALIPSAAGGSFAIIGTAITYLQTFLQLRPQCRHSPPLSQRGGESIHFYRSPISRGVCPWKSYSSLERESHKRFLGFNKRRGEKIKNLNLASKSEGF